MKSASLYIHWPWCKSKCPYCDFNSHTGQTELRNAYLKALIQDIKNQRETYGNRKISSIFFGGGTPSLMTPKEVDLVLNTAVHSFSIEPNAEITIECNPTSSDAEKFKDFAHAGINRISIGVQSLQDNHLRFLGREHSSSEAVKTINSALNAVKNVSLDLIYGLPEQKLTEWQQDIERSVSFGTTHISAYQLTIEKNTKFYSEVRKGKWSPLDSDLQADFFEMTKNTLSKHNFNNYEISNFAKDGYNCKHNEEIWKYEQYFGIGAGAHGRLKNDRNKTFLTQNYKLIEPYIKSVKHCETVHFQKNTLSDHESAEEQVLMGLRLQKGLPLKEVKHILNRQSMQKLEKLGFLSTSDGRLILTNSGWLLLDTILAEIIQ